MIKRPITYTFFDDEGNEVTETEVYWFHLYEEELVEWESKYQTGLYEELQRMLKEQDREQIFAFFKKAILDSYGVREEGGRRFKKTPELRAEFESSVAYKTLFLELVTSEDEAANFVNGVFPKIKEQDKPAIQPATTP